jgi:hypothetical protein
MPFVPLGSRKRIEVILDHDKKRLGNEMRAKDDATVKLHHQLMPGRTGYRYANHPITMGPIRGPEPPFRTANKPWAPPEYDPYGGAALKDQEQAPVGAYTDGSHSLIGETLRKSRSVPALVRTMAANPVTEDDKSLGEQAKEAANPISIELNRWKRLAAVTKRDLESMPELMTTQKREKPKPQKPLVGNTGLVNFPKYMLFENSHLKTQDFQRFVAAEERARLEAEEGHAAVEEAMSRGAVEDTPLSTRPSTSREEELVPYATASWGQPRLRGPPETVRRQWAGSSMPTGRGQRSSNPFRH